ncbi:DOPA-like domain-containing protein [Auriculariales sp. MPI-PUGE-AT-0066]|nr:DOPA-like domain-containing protein [Auriculariales sp. MPI-PUGE-AT-0066]
MQLQMSETPKPPTDVEKVLEDEIKEWHFHIYFHQRNTREAAAALALRDAVLRLRRDGAFVAVPLFRVNHGPMGPHPAGSYEIWVPKESFANVFSYLTLNRGELSVLVHPLTREERKDHDTRRVWMGAEWALDLDTLPKLSRTVPSQYHSLKLGYSSEAKRPSHDELLRRGHAVERVLEHEEEAAPAPQD